MKDRTTFLQNKKALQNIILLYYRKFEEIIIIIKDLWIRTVFSEGSFKKFSINIFQFLKYWDRFHEILFYIVETDLYCRNNIKKLIRFKIEVHQIKA